MPSSLSSVRNAERPVMRFFMFPPARGRCREAWGIMIKLEAPAQGSALMAALRGGARRTCGRSKHPVAIAPSLLFRTMPDHARKALQRHQRFAGIGPFLQLLDGDMIQRLPAGAAGEKRARDVHHVRRARALVHQRCATALAEAARGSCGLVL